MWTQEQHNQDQKQVELWRDQLGDAYTLFLKEEGQSCSQKVREEVRALTQTTIDGLTTLLNLGAKMEYENAQKLYTQSKHNLEGMIKRAREAAGEQFHQEMTNERR